eukprot:CAMPEP_0170339968 /NCGR_PEP_ID=MMETSP0116_2-20130129/71065_1 /TAXON_ID=400756 /ORGANISM="Durinskia baltica, Strain CSIRO CS-38" /LENGTH=295 /DNA_ID=CAMNT_0010593433 /DNA_START=19 /DNA_END=904 /DNA_ORIENTATION=-
MTPTWRRRSRRWAGRPAEDPSMTPPGRGGGDEGRFRARPRARRQHGDPEHPQRRPPRLAQERVQAGRDEVHEPPIGEDVRAGAGPHSPLAPRHLGCHPSHGAAEGQLLPRHHAGEAEVQQFGVEAIAMELHQDVRGLQVAVDNGGLVAVQIPHRPADIQQNLEATPRRDVEGVAVSSNVDLDGGSPDQLQHQGEVASACVDHRPMEDRYIGVPDMPEHTQFVYHVREVQLAPNFDAVQPELHSDGRAVEATSDDEAEGAAPKGLRRGDHEAFRLEQPTLPRTDLAELPEAERDAG